MDRWRMWEARLAPAGLQLPSPEAAAGTLEALLITFLMDVVPPNTLESGLPCSRPTSPTALPCRLFMHPSSL
jgi:hypothetical protein